MQRAGEGSRHDRAAGGGRMGRGKREMAMMQSGDARRTKWRSLKKNYIKKE